MSGLKNEDIYGDVIDAIVIRSAEDRAKSICRGRFLDDHRYVSYFALKAVGDRELTLRVVFVNGRGAADGNPVELKGNEIRQALEKPRVFGLAASKRKAKRVAASLSAPDGYDRKAAYDEANRLYCSLKDVELFDFILIDKGEIISLVRGIGGK